MEAKEAAWREEWTNRLQEERAVLERQLAEEKAARQEAAEAAAASLADERRTWQQRIDILLERSSHLFAEKERLDKNIRQEVDAQVATQVQVPISISQMLFNLRFISVFYFYDFSK